MMKHHFNIEGPCDPREHYMIPSLQRCQDVMGLIARKK